MDGDREKLQEADETGRDDLRDVVLRLSAVESSETSDDDSCKARLSCIIEDDESEPKEAERNKESEKGPPEATEPAAGVRESDSELGDRVQITDLDEVAPREKAEESASDEASGDDRGLPGKKLGSVDNLQGRPFVVRRRELSTDSSDLDVSVTNSAEGPSSGELKIVELDEGDGENTLHVPGDVCVESETSGDADPDAKGCRTPREGEVEVVDNETLSSIFAKVSRTYLEKTKSNVKWEEKERIDRVFKEVMEEVAKAKGDHLSFRDVHIRGTSPRQYDPPVPPETYLWEELKRLRERGGYPWTYLDKPPFDEATWKKYMDHVYEPINPLPLSTERNEEPPRDDAEVQQPTQRSTIPDTEKRFRRIPSGSELSKKPSAEESKTSDELEQEGAREFQDRVESRFLAQTPTATSVTTASQSRTDVTSSVLDTSEFEEVPAKPGSLVKTRREQMRAQAQEIQQRLRNHAGRIRNKFSSMPRPTLGRKDRSKREATGEKLGFRIPEMKAPRISFPDRSKFKLPEKAKFHLPDRSKFHLPERPKLNIAERARSHLPERSRFHLPERPKLHLPDRSRFHLPERPRFNFPNRPRLELPSFKRSPRGDFQSPNPLKSRFEFDLKSYPKLFAKHSKDYTTSSPKQTRGRTPPPRMKPPEPPKKWTHDPEDDLDEPGMRETDSRKSESLFEKDVEYLEDLDKVPTLSTKSSTSRLSELSDDRKKGVLEEINADEFFLRQKGISQDDIDMGKYLSREIREAFRSPDVNALAKLDYVDADEENADPLKFRAEPKRPKRSGSGKTKSILKKTSGSDASVSEDGYKTYPPRRPGRKTRSQSKSLLNEDAAIGEYENEDANASRYENLEDEAEANVSRYDNVEYDEDNASEYYKTPGPAKEYQHYKVPRPHAPVSASPSVKRKSSLEDEGSHKRVHECWDDDDDDDEILPSEPPKPMARRKNRKKVPEHPEPAAAEEQIPQEIVGESEEVVPQAQAVEPPVQESPVPPKRTRTRSSGSRSLRSFGTEDDVNQSFRSEPGIPRPEAAEDEILLERMDPAACKSPPEFRGHEYEMADPDDPGFGYATVGKPSVSKPERQKKKKPERPSPPRRRKEVSVPVYNTFPRRAPVRPLRNYSTLGPCRPPRQKRLPPIEKTLAERQSGAYTEMKSESEEPKDLQTEKVIEKMKGRPLPPPPRPPRQKSKGPEDDLEPTEEEKLSLSILRDEEFPLERRVTAFVHAPPAAGEAVEEVCAATQTDPLPEDFSFGTEEGSDLIPEFSHEQLKIQQAFLEEMKKEEEELRRRGTTESDAVDAELKAEVIRQIEDIIAEEKRILERKNEERTRREEPDAGKPGSRPDVDADMGYASLERRKDRQDPALAPKMEKLQVKELEVESLNAREVQSDQIFVRELQSNRIASQDIDNTGGTVALGNIDLPAAFIDQIVAKIPWDALRQTQPQDAPPVRPHRRQRGAQPQEEDSDEETVFQPRKSHRRHQRVQGRSSDEEEDRRTQSRRQQRATETSSIPELSLQLARACTSAGVQALRSFVQTNASLAQSLDRELCVQAILCIAIALIAGFFLFGFDAKIVHLHHWDLQFPPQPPRQ